MFKRGVFIVWLVFVAMPLVVASDDYVEIFGLNDSQILNSMDVSMVSCIPDGQNIEHSLVCLNNFNVLRLTTLPLNDTCHISFANLHDFGCVKVTFQSIFDRDGRRDKIVKTVLTEQVSIEPTQILNTQKWDGGWDTASDTAYAIWILSQFNTRYNKQINDGMLWLKQHRDDQTKCWPADAFSTSCSVYETSRTLAFLSFAGINDTHRIKADGQQWLESRQNYFESTTGWSIMLNPADDGECTVRAGSTAIITNVTLNDSETYTYSFTPEYEQLINLSCTMRVTFTIFDDKNKSIFGYTFNTDDEFDFDFTLGSSESSAADRDAKRYRFNPPCWSATSKWQYCNKETTLYSLIPPIQKAQRDLAKDWFDDQLEIDTVVGKYVRSAQPFFDSALYLYAVDGNNRDVLNWLVYYQNNDGSWGTGTTKDRVLPTAMAMLALNSSNFSSSKESLKDARLWFSANSPLSGWDATKEDALSVIILKDNALPFLKVHPSQAIVMHGAGQVTLLNPTHLDVINISATISPSLSSVFEVNHAKNISSYANASLSITPKSAPAGSYVGVISFHDGQNNSLLHVPVEMIISPSLDISLPEEVHVFGGSGSIMLEIKTVNANYDCNIDWLPGDYTITDALRITRAGKTSLEISTPLQDADVYAEGTLTCVAGNTTFTNTLAFTVYSHPMEPFTLKKEKITIRRAGKDAAITLVNNLNRTYDVSVNVEVDSGFLELEEDSITLAPKQKRKIVIKNMYPEDINVTEAGTLTISGLTTQTAADITVDILFDPDRTTKMILLIVLLTVLAILGGGGYYAYRNRAKITSTLNNTLETVAKHLPPSIGHYFYTPPPVVVDQNEEKEKNVELGYYEDVVRIMRNLDKTDVQIRERLRAEKLPEDKINQIMNDLKVSDDLEQKIRHEEQVKSLIDMVADTQGDIFKKLRDKGYSEQQIREAMAELETSVEEKEKQFKKELGDKQ